METGIFFDGYRLPKVISYKAVRRARNPQIEYNADGDALIDLKTRKYSLEIYLGELNETQLNRIYGITEQVFFWADFYSPAEKAQYGAEFYLADEPAEVYLKTDGNHIRTRAVKLELEER